MGEICNYINDIAFVSVKHLQLPPTQQLVINFLCLSLSHLNVLHWEEPSVHFHFIIYLDF